MTGFPQASRLRAEVDCLALEVVLTTIASNLCLGTPTPPASARQSWWESVWPLCPARAESDKAWYELLPTKPEGQGEADPATHDHPLNASVRTRLFAQVAYRTYRAYRHVWHRLSDGSGAGHQRGRVSISADRYAL